MRFIVYTFHLITWLFVLQACSGGTDTAVNKSKQALVSVKGKTLYLNEINEVIPRGLTPADSTLAAEAYIKMWIKNELIYDKAIDNLSDKETINELVENYRQSLITYTYQEQLVKERLRKNISDAELLKYYNEHPDQFQLETEVLKGLFLKVPKTSPQLNDLKKWCKQNDNKAIASIEKYSLQNAVIYDLFYDRWVSLDDVLTNIPQQIGDNKQFLANNKYFETEDSTFVYLLKVKEYIFAGKAAPFEFVKGEVMDILINQKKDAFLKEIEEDLYKTAVDKGQIKFYTE